MKNKPTIVILNYSKISAVSEKISAETALFQRWFLALKISVFSAVQSWISAVQRFSGNEQRWNRPESILNQSWSALNVSETWTRVRLHLRFILVIWAIILGLLDAIVCSGCFRLGRWEGSRYCKYNDREIGHMLFSATTALKVCQMFYRYNNGKERQYFMMIVAKITATVFLINWRYWYYFSGKILLKQLFFQLITASMVYFDRR